MTDMIGNRLAKAIRPKPSMSGLRPGTDSASPRPRAATSGTVTVLLSPSPGVLVSADPVGDPQGPWNNGHTVAIGDYTQNRGLVMFLQTLARQNGGDFVGVSR